MWRNLGKILEFFRIVESRDSWEWRAVAQILSWRSLLQQLLCLQVCSRFIWRRFFVKLFWGYLKLSGRLGKKLGNVVCCFFLSPPANHGCSSFSLLTLSYHGFLLIPLSMPSSGSGSSNSSNVGTRYVWSWDRVFGRLSIPGPSRPGIAIYTYNIII